MRHHVLLVLGGAAACSGPHPEPLVRALTDVAHADGRFVAVGGLYGGNASPSGQAYAAVSPDGDAWDVHELPEHNWLRAVTHGNGRWVAAGLALENRPALLVSDDGAAWRPAAAPPGWDLTGLAFGNGVFVATGSTTPAFAVSTDGDTWELVEMGEYWWNARVTFAGDRFIAYGEGAVIAESTDGRTWGFVDLGVTQVHAVAAHQGGVVGIGTYDCCFGEVPDGIQQIRLDGPGTWQARVHEVEWLSDLAVADDTAVAIGLDGVILRAAVLADPWPLAPVTDALDARALAATGSTVVAVGPQIHVSHDAGATWSLALE